MARQTGALVALYAAFESVYGTPPGSGYRQMPFGPGTQLGASRPLLENELLGFGRDPQPPVLDAVTAEGEVVVPIDVENWGVWLKAAFGQPVVAGTIAATGSIAFSAQPAANSTVTINGTVFTFVVSGATGNQVNIGGNLAATMTALATALNASVVPGVAAATYTGAAAALNIVHDTLGAAGNSFTLAASTSPASNGTVSGATLSGGTNSHTFNSGAAVLPSLSIEMAYPQVPAFEMVRGCMVEGLSWSMKRDGLLTAKVKMYAQGANAPAGSTGAGSPTAFALRRFGPFQGAITRDAVSLANVVSADIEYMNNLDMVETIRADGLIDGIDPSIASLKGKVTIRFDNMDLFNQAVNGTPCTLVFSYSLGASASFSLTAHAVYLERPTVSVRGPRGIEVDFDFMSALAVSPARMSTAVLTNSVAIY
jgi:hypothetical protein